MSSGGLLTIVRNPKTPRRLKPGAWNRGALMLAGGHIYCSGAAAAVAGLTLAAATAGAQEQTGAIEGVVRDVQGGLVPAVAVTASNGTGLTVETMTGAAGAYRFPALPPGRYEMSAILDGFELAKVAADRPGAGCGAAHGPDASSGRRSPRHWRSWVARRASR